MTLQKELNKLIQRMERTEGICQDSIRDLRAAKTIDDAAEVFFTYAKFVIGNHFPGIKTMRDILKYGSSDVLAVDVTDSIKNPKRLIVAGDSFVHIFVEDYNISQVIVCKGARVAIHATGRCFVYLRCHREEKDSIEIIEQSEKAKIIWLH